MKYKHINQKRSLRSKDALKVCRTFIYALVQNVVFTKVINKCIQLEYCQYDNILALKPDYCYTWIPSD